MTEENKEVLEEVTEEQVEQPKEEVVEAKVDESKFDSAGNPDIIKIDLSKPPPEENKQVNEEVSEEVKTEVTDEVEEQEVPVVEEVTMEDLKEDKKEVIEQVVEEIVEQPTQKPISESKQPEKNLPENIQKLVDFMEETGGDILDYANLNRDVSKMDNSDVLDEYYRATKPHLTAEERSFMLEEEFSYDDEVDEPKDIKRKKIALKEQVAKARAYLDGQKSKYYKEIKAGSKLTQEQQEAIDFFNRHNKESEEQRVLSEKALKSFNEKTNSVFNENFKGFDFNVGNKKYRFNVKDVNKVKETQSDISNFINKFANKDRSEIEDIAGYHKSFFTAMNADAIANHFYEQGKADATKDRVAKDKNINLNPRQTHGEVNVGGLKVRVLGENTSDMKNRSFKIRKKN